MGFWSIVFFLMFAAVFYVGWRGHQAFASGFRPRYIMVYWVVYLLFAFSFILFERMGLGRGVLKQSLPWLGGYSLAFIFYAVLILILIDLIRLADKWWSFIPRYIKHAPAKIGLTVLLILAGLLAYGTWNAMHPVFTSYQISIAKGAGENSELHAIMVSDLHLGAIVDNDRLIRLVEQINERNPDIIFMVGDVIDGNARVFIEENMAATLAQLKPRLGKYMVMGNHDGHDGDNVVKYLNAAGITVLIDQYQLIDNSFYLVGRSNRGFSGGNSRQPQLQTVLAGVNEKLPVILMDHNPSNLNEALENGIDLQLSGHTHQGQMFPNNLITGSMYDIDWGYMQKNNLQVIVSDGFGTWGPPIRIGNTPEIVDLQIIFKQNN